MNFGDIAALSIKKRLITWVLTLGLLVGGTLSFQGMPRLEDPEFTIKEGLIMTPYPGASAAEVEEEVTSVIEKACQKMGELWWVESRSQRGLSIVKVIIHEKYTRKDLPQVWDLLRKKVGAATLPPGAGPAVVNDDFGDVYGVYMALTGEEYTSRQLEETADFLQRELLLAQDVKSIVLYGVQPQVIYLEMNREKIAELGITQADIFLSLAAKNFPVSAGHVKVGDERLAINPTGHFANEQELGDLLVSNQGLGEQPLVYLRDVATITRGYLEPPMNIMRFNGQTAIGLGISTVSGGNVVNMGAALDVKLAELESQIPLGMELHVVSNQAKAVTASINGFLINLLEAVVIVVVVLLIAMGLRSGLIIGFVLMVTIVGSFIFLANMGTMLERVSLGALIVALGMLVDNAIVVTDGMRVKMGQGIDGLKAAREIVGQSAMPLLAATLVAITAFASIGMAPGDCGEIMHALFQVIFVSLMLSWVTAVTLTPLMCVQFLKVEKVAETSEEAEPAKTGFFAFHSRFLAGCMRLRALTVVAVLVLFGASLIGFGKLKNEFFASATRAQFFIEFWLPEGTSIEATSRHLKKAEDYLQELEGVKDVVTSIAGGDVRFVLTYSPEYPWAAFGQILVNTDTLERIPEMVPAVQVALDELLPDATVNVRKFSMGPGTGGKIQLRISGSDPAVLRELGDQAQAIMEADHNAKGVRNSWRTPVKVVRPQVSESSARRLGVNRHGIAGAFMRASIGRPIGTFRDGDKLLPIIARAPAAERSQLDSWSSEPLWSLAARESIPLGQVVDAVPIEVENPYIWRRNRVKTMWIHADAAVGLADDVLMRVKGPIEEALNVDVAKVLGKEFGPDDDPFKGHTSKTLPVSFRGKYPLKGMPGYFISWGGETEDSARGSAAVLGGLPLCGVLMVLIVILLFNSLKKTLVVFLLVPLAIIGVVFGLLLLRTPFSFVALVGLIALSGMLIKNSIVLIDSIGFELNSGKAPFQAVLDAAVGRVVPVSMAALTTILGMLPLLWDVLFKGMAITIMFGLAFATLLTLVFVPVLYVIIFQIKADGKTA